VQKQKRSEDSAEDGENDQSEDYANEYFVALRGAARSVDISTNQLIVARVCLEPKREHGPDERDQADELVDQDVERHAAKNNLWNPAPNAVNNDGH